LPTFEWSIDVHARPPFAAFSDSLRYRVSSATANMAIVAAKRTDPTAHDRGIRRGKSLGLTVLLSGAAVVPFIVGDFQLFKLTNVLIYTIALLGLNILVGYNGQISLGHGAFYAIGAYAAAILIVYLSVPHWAAAPAAGLVCLIVGLLFGVPALRLDGMCLAMLTFTFGAVLPTVAKYKGVEQWTGGSQGMGLDKPAVPFGLPLSFDQWLYLFTLFMLVGLFAVAANLSRGNVGRAIVAVRDHPIAAQAMGINTAMYKAATFGVSAMYTGIAGALAALSIKYVAPGLFGIFVSFGFLVGIAVGGIASLSGAIYGALFLQVLLLAVGVTAHSLHTPHVYAVYGVALILFLYFIPGGIAGLVHMSATRMRRRTHDAT
jgi:branched-chain amino acid transport system permease protein